MEVFEEREVFAKEWHGTVDRIGKSCVTTIAYFGFDRVKTLKKKGFLAKK